VTVQLQWELYNPSSDDKLYLDELELLSLQVMQEEAYYAYGLAMAGVGSLPGTAEHDYLYQGKELENNFDLAWHDGAAFRFHARAFDAQLGRWHTHDPAYQFASPYVGMGNNPVMGVDLDELGQSAGAASGTLLLYVPAGWLAGGAILGAANAGLAGTGIGTFQWELPQVWPEVP
jgi:RHS repeat-associated protein